MRALALLPLLFVASCGEGPAENKAAPAAEAPSPGQWELASQVTRFRNADQGTAKIATPVGTRATQNLCVTPGARLPTELFSGEGFTCSYGTYYARAGRVNLTLNCRREGLSGDIPMTVDGTFTADSITLHRNLRTILSTEGDVEIDADITGRRTGACTPAAAGDESQNRH
jgi:uncharacterized protein DUF3617